MAALPKFVRDELGMQLIDLNTNWLESYEDSYVRRVRESAEDADCFFTNLKVNHKFGDLYADDANERQKAMAHARQLVTAARLLGAQWMRFSIPKPVPGSRTATLSAHRELASVAESQGVQLLVENNGWMRSEPGSVAELVRIIGKNIAPGPDTGNWNDDVRYEGIAKSFTDAVHATSKSSTWTTTASTRNTTSGGASTWHGKLAFAVPGQSNTGMKTTRCLRKKRRTYGISFIGGSLPRAELASLLNVSPVGRNRTRNS